MKQNTKENLDQLDPNKTCSDAYIHLQGVLDFVEFSRQHLSILDYNILKDIHLLYSQEITKRLP